MGWSPIFGLYTLHKKICLRNLALSTRATNGRQMIHMLEVLQNFSEIQGLNYFSFLSFHSALDWIRPFSMGGKQMPTAKFAVGFCRRDDDRMTEPERIYYTDR